MGLLSPIPICRTCRKRIDTKFCPYCGSRIALHEPLPLRDYEISALVSEIAYYGCLACPGHKASDIIEDVYLANEISSATYEFGSCSYGNRYRTEVGGRVEYGNHLDQYALRLLELLVP